MSIGLKSDSSGTSGSIVINGSDKVVVTSAGNVTAGTFTGALTGSLTAGGSVTSGVAVASTSGTAIDFTGIPSWVKRITVMLNGVSVSGTSPILLQLGDSGGIENTGYSGMSGLTSAAGANSYVGVTSGIPLGYSTMSAASQSSGNLRIVNLSGNNWIIDGILSASSLDYLITFAGAKETSAILDRIRITTFGGSNTFDAGSINIMYEG